MIFKGLYEEREQEEVGWYVKLHGINSNEFYCGALTKRGTFLGDLFHMDTKTGKLTRMFNVPKELGFDLDNDGRIKVKE